MAYYAAVLVGGLLREAHIENRELEGCLRVVPVGEGLDVGKEIL